MDDQVASIFFDVVTDLMESMVGLPCNMVQAAADEQLARYVSGIVTINGNAVGQVAVSLSREVGEQLVAQMSGLEITDVNDEILRDGIGEVANIIAGGAKSKLAQNGFELKLSLPSVIVGEGHELGPIQAGHVTHYIINCELGAYQLAVWLTRPSGGGS